MSNIAIDIALLPPTFIMDEAIAINRQLLAGQPSVLELGYTCRLPHLTLMQAVIKKKDLANAETKLEQLAAAFDPLHLRGKLTSAHDATFFQIKESADLHNLHETVMKRFEKIVSYNAKQEDYDDVEVRQRTINFVNNFRTLHSFENFDPHITLGVGVLPTTAKNISFTTKSLAICRLGNFNTCKKVLFETRFKGS